MDGERFDRITRALASGASRRRVVKGLAGGIAAGLAAAVGRRAPAEAQVSQAQCGNVFCASDPGVCNEGCVCCVYSNGNSRCRPPGKCGPGQEICANGEPSCGSDGCCLEGEECVRVLGEPFCTPSSGNGTVVEATTAQLWHAFTDAETLTALGLPTTIAPRVGHRFQFHATPRGKFDGVIEAEMTEVEVERRYSFMWLNGPVKEGTILTVHLDPIGDGSRTAVRLTHTDPTGKSCRASALILGQHWSHHVLKETLPQYLAEGRLR